MGLWRSTKGVIVNIGFAYFCKIEPRHCERPLIAKVYESFHITRNMLSSGFVDKLIFAQDILHGFFWYSPY